MTKKKTEEEQEQPMTAADLKQDEHNYRRHSEKNKARIKKSIDEAGLGRSVVVDADGVIIAGNGVQSVVDPDTPVRVIETDGSELVVVKRTDLHTDDPRRKTLALADNATSDDVEWDMEAIAEDWTDDEAEEWGVVECKDEGDAERKEVKEDDFDPDKPVETVCEKGDIWKLGNHRLMCGDSTDAGDVALLMDGQRARMVVTSPPYGVGKDYEQAGIEQWRRTIRGVIDAIKGKALIICWNIGDLFTTGTQFTEPTGAYSIAMWDEAGYGMLYNRIWKKPGGNFTGSNPYYTVTTKPVQEYEYLYAFAERDADKYVQPIKDYLFGESKKANISNEIIKSNGGPAYMFGHWFTDHQWALIDKKNYALIQSYCEKNGIDAFKKDYVLLKDEYLRNTIFSHSLQDNEFSEWGMYGIWEFSTVHNRLGGHAAAFPVELPTRYIKLHSYEGDIVLEPFGGTGTTLIAAEQLNRKCFMMELDPHYCDVIIARWEQFTGQKAYKLE